MMPNKEAPSAAENNAEPQMLRFLKICGGIVAFSFFQICMATKAAIDNPKITNKAMTLPLDHGYFEPPH
jgi:hypothetical protein